MGASCLGCLVDGRPAGSVPVLDRGLAYGDGVFETLLIRASRPCLWGRHLARLRTGAMRLGIPPPADASWRSDAHALVTAHLGEEGAGVLKLVLTRGEGGRGYRPDPDPRPRRLAAIFPLPSRPFGGDGAGVRVRLCTTPASQNPALAGLKHLNRLDSVLARAEWDDPAIAEGLMPGPEGDIIGGTMSNLFLWDGSRLSTPAVDRAGIAGTVRGLALDLARRAGIPCLETRVTRGELAGAAGAFLTNSVIGVWPVARIGDWRYDPARLPGRLVADLRAAAQAPEDPWP